MKRYPLDIKLPSHVEKVVTTLRNSGHNAWLVGGAVRDSILSHTPKDYDIATDAKPQDIQKYFDRTIPVGVQFGVVLVIIDSAPVEVATFRSDGAYEDGRHPTSITYSKPEDDAKRRDFTINGLFWDPSTKEVIDYISGMADIESRQIRTIGRASHRFQEDALRTVRAVRLLAQLSDFNFELEENLHQGIRRQGHLILEASKERITEEVQKILKSSRPSLAFQAMKETKLFDRVFPDFRNLSDNEFKHMTSTLDNLYESWVEICAIENCYTNALLWASFLYFFPGDRKNLKQQNSILITRIELKEIKKIHTICAEIPQLLSLSLARQKRILAESQFLSAACLYQSKENPSKGRKVIAAILQKRKSLSDKGKLNPHPLISGNDLKRLGLSPGPEMGQILFRIRELQLEETLKTKKEALKQAKALQHELENPEAAEN